jgi:hypothetical protein
MMDDQGWILADTKTTSKLSFNSIVKYEDYDLSVSPDFLKSYAANLLLSLKKEILLYKRSYMKIQEVFAQMGGLLAIIQTLSSMILLPINDYEKTLFIINKLIQIKSNGQLNDDMESNNIIKIKSKFIIK